MSVDPRYAARFQRGFDPSEHGAGDAAGAAPAAGDTRSASSSGSGAADHASNPFTRPGAARIGEPPVGAAPSPYSRDGAASLGTAAGAAPPDSAGSDSRASAPPSIPPSASEPATIGPASATPRATRPVRLGPNGERVEPARVDDPIADHATRYAEVADELTDDELGELGLIPRHRINPWTVALAVVSLVALVLAVALSMSTYEMQADSGYGFDSDRDAADQTWVFFLQQAGQTLAEPLYFVGVLGSAVTIVLLVVLRRRR
ncbi:hypothetical protein [Schumannella soli]|uniref:Uncharacterized protein n=1 Tax=Schumannella soli TaxID=2590779 RepID=A0A506Y5V0_9MICO|nr:hypothetical protein [Schumannella soli]TPW78026.1 hypothetical protein FJ657_05205 [Schumannella soli]